MRRHIRKQIDTERIKIGRSPGRQASKAISIVVFPQTSEGQYDPGHKSGLIRTLGRVTYLLMCPAYFRTSLKVRSL